MISNICQQNKYILSTVTRYCYNKYINLSLSIYILKHQTLYRNASISFMEVLVLRDDKMLHGSAIWNSSIHQNLWQVIIIMDNNRNDRKIEHTWKIQFFVIEEKYQENVKEATHKCMNCRQATLDNMHPVHHRYMLFMGIYYVHFKKRVNKK